MQGRNGFFGHHCAGKLFFKAEQVFRLPGLAGVTCISDLNPCFQNMFNFEDCLLKGNLTGFNEEKKFSMKFPLRKHPQMCRSKKPFPHFVSGCSQWWRCL